MKFEYDENNQEMLGLDVRAGANGSVVFVWDCFEDAAEYHLELYRIDKAVRNGYVPHGFLKQAQFSSYANGIYANGIKILFNDDAKLAWFDKSDLLFVYLDRRGMGGYHYSRLPFSDIKPLCEVSVERSIYYKNIADLPQGLCAVILKIEDRNGEIIKQSIPYIFAV